VKVARYRAGERRYLAVDAERYVPDRAAFAATHCDGDDGVTPPDDARTGLVHADQGVSGPQRGPGPAGERGVAADGGPGQDDAADRAGAHGVLFLALEPSFQPPRVVMTVVHPDGEHTLCCEAGVRCAARWAATRTDADRVMVDTQAGTRAARVHPDGSVSAEVGDGGRSTSPAAGARGGPADGAPMERGPVVREFVTDVADPRP
jgi:diaminopimelate epimerase